MKKTYLILLLFSFQLVLFSQENIILGKKLRLGINISPFLKYRFKQTDSQKTNNLYNFQVGGSATFFFKKINKLELGITSGLQYSTLNFETKNLNQNENLKGSMQKYSLFSLPFLINFSYSLQSTINIEFDIGLIRNYFNSKSCIYYYKDHNSIEEDLGNLDFDPFLEYHIGVSVEKQFKKIGGSLMIQTFINNKINEPSFYKYQFYNLIQSVFGINIIINKQLFFK
jgi:hypothetical protein